MPKVVAVEDDAEIAELMGFVLDSPAITLFTASDGVDGLDLIRAAKPDLVIMDIMMPGDLNGWDVYDAVRADDALRETPVIMLSVMGEHPDRRRRFANSTIDLYMTKPFDALRLRREVERMLGGVNLWAAPEPPPARTVEPPPPAAQHHAPLEPDEIVPPEAVLAVLKQTSELSIDTLPPDTQAAIDAGSTGDHAPDNHPAGEAPPGDEDGPPDRTTG